MPATYEPIATTTTTTATTQIDFTSISGNYTDLVLVSYVKFNSGGSNGTVHFQANGDTGSNYSYTYVQGSTSGTGTGRGSNATIGVVGQGSSSSGSDFGIGVAHFQNYSNTTTNKTVICRANATNIATQSWVSLWRSTAAITSLKIDGPYQFASGCTFTLYGIKAA